MAKWGAFGLWRERESLLGKRDRFVEVGASVEIDLARKMCPSAKAGCSGWTASAHRFAPLDRPRLHRAVTG